MEFVSVLSNMQIAEVAALADEIWREHYGKILPEGQIAYMLCRFQSADAIRAQIAEESYSYYLLREGEETLGYLGFCRKNGGKDEPKGVFLSKLYVKKSCRGRGAARSAVHFLNRLCLEEGYTYLWLTVNRDNAGSIACYKKLGFSNWYEQRADIGGGWVMDDFVMKKTI